VDDVVPDLPFILLECARVEYEMLDLISDENFRP
jgi:hypothetical protein